MIVDRLVRATLPIAGPVSGPPGTAFLYNHLLGSTDGVDHVVELLVTADVFAQHEMLEFKLRPDMIEPVGVAADNLLVTDVARSWTHDPAGFAFVKSAFLHAHGRRKGWRWTTQELTDGFAARPHDLADIGADQRRGFLLGHTVEGPSRPLVLMSSSVRRDDAGVVRWVGPVPDGLVGSPVFTVRQLDARAIKVVCVGVLLAGTQDNPVATFDAIRHAVALTLPAR
jgi:hypothetical protein